MKKIALLFPGQGSQFVGMGKDVYDHFDYVREIFDMAGDICKRNVARLCFAGPMEELTATVNLQPAVTAVNLAFWEVLSRNGVTPECCAGHSLGEYGALCAAGVVGRPETMAMVHQRGRLMHEASLRHQGAMSAIIGLTIDQVQTIVTQSLDSGTVAVANHNSATQIVITGSPEAVAEAGARARAAGAKAIALKVSGAWHSPLIQAAQGPFAEFLQPIGFAPPRSKVIFNVSAAIETEPEAIRRLMADQLCAPVRWYDSMRLLLDQDIEVAAEVGPGKVLTGLLKKTLPRDRPCAILPVGCLAELDAFFKTVA